MGKHNDSCPVPTLPRWRLRHLLLPLPVVRFSVSCSKEMRPRRPRSPLFLTIDETGAVSCSLPAAENRGPTATEAALCRLILHQIRPWESIESTKRFISLFTTRQPGARPKTLTAAKIGPPSVCLGGLA